MQKFKVLLILVILIGLLTGCGREESIIFKNIDVCFSLGGLIAAILDYSIDKNYNNIILRVTI